MQSDKQVLQPEAAETLPEESLQQPVWHVLVLNVLTLFAYSAVWFYKSWRQLVEFAGSDEHHAKLDVHTVSLLKSIKNGRPFLWSLGVVVPIWQLYATTRFFTTALGIAAAPGFLKYRRWPAGILLTAIMLGLLYGGTLPGAFYLLFLTAALPLAFVQHQLNQFWSRVEPEGRLVRHAFSVAELVAMIAGSMVLGLIGVSFIWHL